MKQPSYQYKLERMISDQKEILVEAAYGDSRIWQSLAALYQFAPADEPALRSYIIQTYAPDGRLVKTMRPALGNGRRSFQADGPAAMGD